MITALAMVCAPVAGLRVPSCCRCPWQPQRLTLAHLVTRSLERALVSAPFQSVRFPFSPVPRNKMLLAVFSTGLKKKKLAQGEFNPSLPRLSMLDLPPALSSNPAS